jgi:hypothetical protein
MDPNVLPHIWPLVCAGNLGACNSLESNALSCLSACQCCSRGWESPCTNISCVLGMKSACAHIGAM